MFNVFKLVKINKQVVAIGSKNDNCALRCIAILLKGLLIHHVLRPTFNVFFSA